jgi:hypothetical protein
MWALFGYSIKEPYGQFLAERKTKEELEDIENKAKEQGYTSFSYSHADGSMPDFIKAITV